MGVLVCALLGWGRGRGAGVRGGWVGGECSISFYSLILKRTGVSVP